MDNYNSYTTMNNQSLAGYLKVYLDLGTSEAKA